VYDENYRNVDLNGRNLTVDIRKGTAGGDAISLKFVYALRKALENAGAAVNAIDADGLTPVYNGDHWCEKWRWKVKGDYISLFETFPKDADTPIMEGIKVSTVDSKYVVVYDRALKVANLIWGDDGQKGLGNADFSFIYRFGLKKGNESGSIITLSSGDSGILWGEVYNFAEYEEALKELGLSYSQNVFVNQNDIKIRAVRRRG
jgi:hypothetical protein